MTALERMELIIPARSGLNPMLAVLQGKAARVLLACTRRLVLSESLLVPTGRREKLYLPMFYFEYVISSCLILSRPLYEGRRKNKRNFH